MRYIIPFFLSLLLLAGCATPTEQELSYRQISIDEAIGTEEIPELPDNEQLILVYCRSGNRSKQASQKLADLGHTNIVEFGGINDWPGETVSDGE